VGLEGGIGFMAHGVAEAVAPDHHHGFEVVGGGTVFLALGRGKLYGGHGPIIGAR
jgi:hypothetical protein